MCNLKHVGHLDSRRLYALDIVASHCSRFAKAQRYMWDAKPEIW